MRVLARSPASPQRSDAGGGDITTPGPVLAAFVFDVSLEAVHVPADLTVIDTDQGTGLLHDSSACQSSCTVTLVSVSDADRT